MIASTCDRDFMSENYLRRLTIESELFVMLENLILLVSFPFICILIQDIVDIFMASSSLKLQVTVSSSAWAST